MTYKTTDVAAKLSTAMVVNSARFAVATPAKQTEILAQAGGLPIIFVSSFNEFANRRKIRDALISGNDVSLNLEFIGIELTEEDRRIFALIQPLMDKLVQSDSAGWSPGTEVLPSGVEVLVDRVHRNGYSVSVDAFKGVWRKASRYWYNVDNLEAGKRIRKPDGVYIQTSSSQRCVSFYKQELHIGCQTIPRTTVEAIARHLDLEWNIPT